MPGSMKAPLGKIKVSVVVCFSLQPCAALLAQAENRYRIRFHQGVK